MSNNLWRPDATGEAWFRVGRVNVTSTVIAVAIGAIGLLMSVVMAATNVTLLAYLPNWMLEGQVWRIVTWPLADAIGLWSILNLVMLWYFGRELELHLGRKRMAWLLLGIAVALILSTTLVTFVLRPVALAGLGMVEMCVLLLWIAEWPTRRFFFNIPAWGFGAFIVGLQVLTLIMARQWPNLLSLVISLVLVAVLARYIGLLRDYTWIPGGRLSNYEKNLRAATQQQTPSRSQRRQHERRQSDDQRMDDLLAKISSEGIHSLSKSERAELDKLRERRQR